MTRSLTLSLILLTAASAWAAEPYTVDRADIVQMVRERGALEAANAVDIAAPSGGTKEKPLVIKWVIEEGTHFKKGERLIEFDDSALREQMTMQQLAVDQIAATSTAAEREATLAQLTGAKELRTAQATIELAELVVKNSAEADELAKKRLELRVRQGEVAVEKAKLALKAENTETAKLAVQTAEIERESALLELKQFELSIEPARKQNQARARETRDELELVKLRAEQRAAQAVANVRGARLALVQEKTRLDAIALEVKNCSVTAPTDGIVVYYIPERSRFGAPAPIIAQGEPVTAGQKLLRIPDLKRMKVETRVHESQVSQLRGGQAVQVRVDAFPNQELIGTVESVSTVASPLGFRNRDVKVYPVNITLPEVAAPLKPGMTAEVAIHVATAKKALRIPIAAVMRSGRKGVCALETADGVRETEIITGISDGKFVEIKAGLKEGDKVQVPANRD